MGDIVIIFDERQDKKHSVRFDCTDEGAPVKSIYVKKSVVTEMGNPSKIKITIEKA